LVKFGNRRGWINSSFHWGWIRSMHCHIHHIIWIILTSFRMSSHWACSTAVLYQPTTTVALWWLWVPYVRCKMVPSFWSIFTLRRTHVWNLRLRFRTASLIFCRRAHNATIRLMTIHIGHAILLKKLQQKYF
jgi:hypothetical protein